MITGKGWWYGGRALEMAQVLRRLLLPGQAHWLFAPGAEPMRAYLTRFDYTCTTARDGVQYSFTFTEDDRDRGAAGMLLTAAPGCGRGKTPLTLRRAPVCR